MRSVSFSDGVMVDLTAPECAVRDGSRNEADLEFSTTGIPRVYVACEDLESGAERVQWALGTVRGWDDTMSYQDALPSGQPVPAHKAAIHASTTTPHHVSPFAVMDAELISLTTPLLDGVRYYGVVLVSNGAGTKVVLTTNGQVHDSSAPIALYIRDTLSMDESDGLEMVYSADLLRWGVAFDVRDPHTGMDSIVVQLVTAGQTVLDEVTLTVNATRVVRSLSTPLVPGELVWARIIADNTAGLRSVIDSDGWVPDDSPPVFTTSPTDGLTFGEDAEFQAFPGALPACWVADDPETQVSHFRVAIAAGSGPATPLTSWSVVPRSASSSSGFANGAPFVAGVTCTWVSGLAIQQGESYRVMVQAVNVVGLESVATTTGVVVDWTPPLVGAVSAVPHGSAASPNTTRGQLRQADRTKYNVVWGEIIEVDSTLATVDISLGSVPGGDDVVARTPLTMPGAQQGGQFTFTSLSLRDGVSYYATLWAQNSVGLLAVRSSAGIQIDGSAPTFVEFPHIPFVPAYAMPRRFDDQEGYPVHVANVSIFVPLLGFADPHSGIASAVVEVLSSYDDPAVAAGQQTGSVLPANWAGERMLSAGVDVDVSDGIHTALIDGVNATNGTFVWATVTVTNHLGASTVRSSRAVQIDTEALSAGVVLDGSSGTDASYQPSVHSFSATWKGFTDPRSVILYSVCLGTSAGECDIRDWEDVRDRTYIDVLQDFEVERGTTVYATVEARTELGLTAQASSDGVILGAKPPAVGNITFTSTSNLGVTRPAGWQHNIAYVSSGPVSVSWDASDEQGIDGCQIDLHDSPLSSSPPVLSGNVTGQQRTYEWDVTLPDSTVLYATVACTNIRARTTVVTAEQWAVVETTPPMPGTVVAGRAVSRSESLQHTGNETTASAFWHGFTDDESHVVDFVACLGTASNACLLATVPTGTVPHVTVDSLAMEHGVEYLWTVTATNGAGATVSARSAPFSVDLVPPDVSAAFAEGSTPNGVLNPPVDEITMAADSFVVSWGGFKDTVSGIDHYVVSLGWSEFASDIAADIHVAANKASFTVTGLAAQLQVGGAVYATVQAVDGVGRGAEVSAPPVFVDATAPVAPTGDWAHVRERFNASTSADIDIQTGTRIDVVWADFNDPETGIDHYEVQVEDVTGPVAVPVLEWSNVQLATHFAHSALAIEHAHTYRTRVRAFNAAGGWTEIQSDAVAVDLTPPVAGSVRDGYTHAGGDVEISARLDALAAHWTSFEDPDSAIVDYEWCVGTAPGKSDVVECQSVGLAHVASATVDEIDMVALLSPAYGQNVAEAVQQAGLLENGKVSPAGLAAIESPGQQMPTFYSTVTVTNELGLRTTAYSSGVQLDVIPPRSGTVSFGRDALQPSQTVVPSSARIYVSWFGFAEEQSSLDRFVVKLGTAPGLDDVAAEVTVDPAESTMSFDNVDVADGVVIFATVDAFDIAGNVGSNSTVAGLLVDASPPNIEWVRDYDADSESMPSPWRAAAENATVTITWSATDSESSIEKFEVSLCRAVEMQVDDDSGTTSDTCALDWTNVGRKNHIQLVAPPMTPGMAYIATVRATNGAGLSSTKSTGVLTMDDSEPVAGSVWAVEVPDAEVQLNRASQGHLVAQLPSAGVQSSWDNVAVQWSSWTDDESGITEYIVCVGTAPQAGDLAPCHSVGMQQLVLVDTSAASAYSAQQSTTDAVSTRGNFTAFYVTVIGVSGSGLTSSATSEAVQVDVSPPSAGVVLDGTSDRDDGFTVSNSSLCVTVEGFQDLESGIAGYETCIGSAPDSGCDIAAFTPATISKVSTVGISEICRHDLSLEHGDMAYVTVRATNGAGNSATSASDGVVVVLEDPDAGIVRVAPLSANDTIDRVAVAAQQSAELYGQRRAVGATWTEFGTQHVAPIVSYAVAVCGLVTGCNSEDNALSRFTEIGLRTNVTLGAQGLLDGEGYAFHVRATDATGRSVTARSATFTIDTSPPRAGSVNVISYGVSSTTLNVAGVVVADRPLVEEQVKLARGLKIAAASQGRPLWHAGFAPLHVSWDSFGDGESGLALFRVCVGSDVEHVDDIAQCRELSPMANYTLFTASDVNATAVRVAREAAAAAAAAAATALDEADRLDALADNETGLLPDITESTSVQAAASMIVRVEACNTVGLCTPVLGGPASVDFTGPVFGYVSGPLDAAGDSAMATSDTHSWSAEWDECADTESGVAYYLAAIWDITSQSFAMEPVNVGTQTSFSAGMLRLEHGHHYVTQVTAVNHAGITTMGESHVVVVDTTPAEGGFLHDIFDLDDDDTDNEVDIDAPSVDADFGDAENGAIEARWGGWVDPESGDALRYEWAVMLLDPRNANPVGALHPSATLREAVTRYLQASGAQLDLPPRQYGTGAAMTMFTTENGLQFTDWLDVGNATSAFRVDVDLITGATYVVLLRITNSAGLARIVASDGIIFDTAEPCIDIPHAGQDPNVVPKYLTAKYGLAAVWRANMDPLHQRDAPVVCRTQVEANTDQSSRPSNMTQTPDVAEAVVPLSHMEWRLRLLLPPPNATEKPPLNVTSNAPSTFSNATATVTTNGTLIEDGAVGVAEPNATSITKMPFVQAGSKYASPWSGCCSAYSELNPQVLNEEWDWRPIQGHAGFGTQLSIVQQRFVLASSVGSATVFDMLSPNSQEHVVTIEVVSGEANVAAPAGEVLHAAGDDMLVFATSNAMSVRARPPSFAHELHSGVSVSSTADRTGIEAIASMLPGDSSFSRVIDGVAFTGVSFTGAVATADDVVAFTLDGVLGAHPARGVAIVRVNETARTWVTQHVLVGSSSFGEAVAVSFDHAARVHVLSVSSPASCTAPPSRSGGTTYEVPCAAGVATDGNVTMYAVTVADVVPIASTRASTVGGSSLWGARLAASGAVAVVGDPAGAGGNGQVTVLAHRENEPSMVVCTVQGAADGAGLGYSVDVIAADVETTQDPRNKGTALVVAGAPAGNLATIIRVNMTALDDDSASDVDVCSTVAVLRQRPSFASNSSATVPPLYGAGTSVAIGGGVAIFTSPFEHTWPSAVDSDAQTALSGTGRVFGASFCWAGDVRKPSTFGHSNLPTVCEPCSGLSTSAGGTARTCESCGERVCRAPNDYVFSATNDTVPLEMGVEYAVDVTAVSRSGRRNTQTSPRFSVDWTPPNVGRVDDMYVGTDAERDACAYCRDEIDYNTNASYLAIEWCCGWDDAESGLQSYSVAFGTSPDDMDIMPWLPVGLNDSFTLPNVVLETGMSYYGCVVAVNNAGLFSEVVCSDGVIYDDTPPVMLEVNDGLQAGFDVDTQSFLNIAVITYQGQDNETGILDYIFYMGPEPGSDFYLAEESGSNSTINGVVNRPFDVAPGEGDRIYGTVYAVNPVGLVSEPLSSDGVVIGKGEVDVTPDTESTMALDVAPTVPKGEEEVAPKKTVAMVKMPPGAVDSPVNILGGTVNSNDVSEGSAVNVSTTPPPKPVRMAAAANTIALDLTLCWVGTELQVWRLQLHNGGPGQG